MDQVELYSLDHMSGTEIGLTPDGEMVSYKPDNTEAPDSAHLQEKERSILSKLDQKNDGKSVDVEKNDTIFMNFGDIRDHRWTQSKLVVTASGFESYTEEGGPSPYVDIKSARSLHFSIRVGDGKWTKVDVIHPRNHPSDYVLPLKETIQQNYLGNMRYHRGRDTSLQVKINCTQTHNIDRIGLDDSTPQPVIKKEADLKSAIQNESGIHTDVTSSIMEDNDRFTNIEPGEEIHFKLSVPEKSFGPIFNERNFIIVTKGTYYEYQG